MWLWIVAVFSAFFIKGMCGFANTLVFNSIMGFGANNIDFSPVEIVLGFPSNVILAWKNRRNLKLSVCAPLTVLMLAGCIPGAFFLKNVNAEKLKVLFGFLIILLAIEMYFRERSTKKWKENKIVLALIGLLSGLLCGLFGVGALLAAYVSRVTGTNDEFKGNICFVFTAENIFRIILYSALGIITLSSVKQALFMAPVMLLGLFLGMKSSQFMDEKLVKKLVIVLLIISGVLLIIKNI